MNLIVAVDQNWGIGKDNELLIRIPADQKNFRAMTTGNVVVLGRKTLDTFPNGMPLKNRTNIMLTKEDRKPKADEIICHSVEQTLNELKKYPSENVFIIGGDSIYRQFIQYCDTAYVTRIDHSYSADAYFPNLEESDEWILKEESEEQTYFDITYTFCTYVRSK